MSAVLPPADNPLQTCPYNISHQILKSRFQTHLVKCRKNHKNVKMATCPFNVTHLIHEPELNWHVTNCPDRASLDRYKYVIEDKNLPTSNNLAKKKDQIQLLPEPLETSENWDNEDAPSYNPESYTSKAPILRQIIGAPPSKRKAFREAERRRLNAVNGNTQL